MAMALQSGRWGRYSSAGIEIATVSGEEAQERQQLQFGQRRSGKRMVLRWIGAAIDRVRGAELALPVALPLLPRATELG